MRVVQVVRDPWDNIATMARRAPRRSLAHHVDTYFALAGTVDAVRQEVPPERFHALRHEDLVADPSAALAGLCGFLGVPVEPAHLAACAAVVFPAPRRTRDMLDWPADVRSAVIERAARHPWLDAYRVRRGGAVKTKQANRRPSVARVVSGVRDLPGFRNYPALYVGSALKSRRYRGDLASVRAFLVFVGHPRSGHSLVGSLLDAHPRMVVSHELDVLKYVAAGYRRDQLLTLVLEHARVNVAAGRTSWGYSYAVPGQWQGRYRDLAVVGDKRGA